MFELAVPGRLEALDDLIQGVEAFADENGLSAESRYGLNLISEELFVNVVRHATAHAVFQINIERVDRVLEVSLLDNGAPFNPLELVDPNIDDSLEQREVGGLGVYLAKNLGNEFSYERRDGWNVVGLTLPLD